MKKGYRDPNPRLKQISAQLNDAEHEAILKQFRNSTCYNLAQFIRYKMLGRTIHVKYRNASMDDFLTEMIPLKRGLIRLVEDVKQSKMGWAPEQQRILFEKTDLIIEKLINVYNICTSA